MGTMKDKISNILEDLEVTHEGDTTPKNRQCVTIWLSSEMKEKYDRLQELSGKQFSKKAREILIVAINQADDLIG